MLVSSSRALLRPSLALRVGRTYATTSEYDCVVVGAGPAGYIAAIKASQLGLKTACIEKSETLGGTCLNVGCIPSKAMLQNSLLYHQTQHDLKKRGIDVGSVTLNLDQMRAAKEKAVRQLTGGVAGLFKKNKIDWLKGVGSFTSAESIQVTPSEGDAFEVKAKNFIIATGSEVSPFPGIEIDEEQVVTSTGALSLKQVPKKLVVIGGGIIGLEMGSVWKRLGAEVEVVEYMGAIAGQGVDGEVAKEFQKILKKQGINFRLNTKVLGLEKRDGKAYLQVEPAKGGDKAEIEADVVLVAIGRRPYTASLGLDKIGVELDERGRVVIDSQYNTSIPNIKCVGDVTFGPMLAHKGEEEGVAAVEYLKTGHGHVNYEVIPSVVYTHPEVAWVGKTEEELKKADIKYRVGKFPYIANSRAKTVDDTDGFVKFLTEAETDQILGVHIIGQNAGEAIAEAALAIEYKASAEDLARTCHAHPTLSEAVKEAAMAAYDKPLNF